MDIAHEKPRFDNEFLNQYLDYIEDTESPRMFHIWSALTGVAACQGRHTYLPFGIGPIFPNMYVTLVGHPGLRKSTAVSILAKRIGAATGMKIAPDDTNGLRQGLIAEMTDDLTEETQGLNGTLDAAFITANLEELGSIQLRTDSVDDHVMFAPVDEFTTLIGAGQTETLTFLGKLFDGSDYRYRLKKQKLVLKDPLMTILGATTPVLLADAMPITATGQGFLSRLILVFASSKYKEVEIPPELSQKEASKIDELFRKLYYDFHGEFKLSPNAESLVRTLYHEKLEITDSRFIYYAERRHTHLIKLALNLAASRLDFNILEGDIKDARTILRATEKNMPDALGEFGLNPAARAKQTILEVLSAANKPILTARMWIMLQKDVKMVDFYTALQELVAANRITRIRLRSSNMEALIFNSKAEEDAEAILQGRSVDDAGVSEESFESFGQFTN